MEKLMFIFWCSQGVDLEGYRRESLWEFSALGTWATQQPGALRIHWQVRQMEHWQGSAHSLWVHDNQRFDLLVFVALSGNFPLSVTLLQVSLELWQENMDSDRSNPTENFLKFKIFVLWPGLFYKDGCLN